MRSTHLISALSIHLLMCSAVTADVEQPRAIHKQDYRSFFAAILLEECDHETYDLCRRFLNREKLAYEEEREAIATMADILERRHNDLSDAAVESILAELEEQAQQLERNDEEVPTEMQSTDADGATKSTTRSVSSPVPGTQLAFGDGNIDGADTIGANKLQGDSGLTFDYDTGGSGSLSFDVQSNGSSVVLIDDNGLNVDTISDNGGGNVSLSPGSHVEITSGNLGIGTSSPSQAIHLKGSNNALLDGADVTTDGGTSNSATLTLRGHFDSDSTSSITDSAQDASIQHIVSSTSPDSRIAFDISGTEFLNIDNGGSIDVKGNNLDSLTNLNASTASTLTVQTSTNSNSTSETADLKLDATTAESGDTAHVVLSGGASGSGSGDVQVTSGSLDVQTTLTNTTGNIAADTTLDLNGNNLTDSTTSDITLGTNLNMNGNTLTDSGSNVQLGNTLELAGNTIQSATTDSALTITQDSNSSDTTAEDLTIETIDSSSNNAVGNIILSSDSGNASPADIVFNTSATERARIDGNGLNVDNLNANGSGSVTMGSTLDLNNNNLTDSSTSNITLGTNLNMNGNTLTDSGSNVQLGNTLELAGNTIQSATTDSPLTITQDSNSSDTTAENLTIETIDSSSNNAVGNIILSSDSGNVSPADIVFNTSTVERARIDGNGLNVDNLNANGSGSVTMGSTIDLNGNTLNDSTTSDITLGTNLDLNGSNLTDNTSSDVTLGTNLNANTNNINSLNTLSGSNGTNLTINNATASDGSNGTVAITIDAVESETGDTANIDLNVGANNGNLKATNLKSGTGTALVLDNGNIVTDSSSKRFKKDIQWCSDKDAEKVLQLEPSHFRRASTGEPEYGLIAEQVEPIIPELVTYENDGETPHSVMYHRLSPLVLKAVQQQQKTISAQSDLIQQQQQEIAALQQQYAYLEDEVTQLKQLINELVANQA